MRADLLERGRQLLLADAANPHGVKFNLATWAAPDRNKADMITDPAIVRTAPSYASYAEDLIWADDAKVPVSCGTQACAMGLFAISRAFEAEGLTYTISGGGNLYPSLGDKHGFNAAAALFEISDNDAQYLFDSDCYDTTPVGEAGEKLVAARIAEFINGDIEERRHPSYEDDDDAYDDGEGDDE